MVKNVKKILSSKRKLNLKKSKVTKKKIAIKNPAKKKLIKRLAVKKPVKILPKKKSKKLELVKSPENPVILPVRENEWEAWQTFNPGAVLLEDKVHFLYRAIGPDGISRLGYARSDDGFSMNERLPYPVFEHRLTPGSFSFWSFASGGSFGGAEDPRIVRVDEEGLLYMTYTACDGGLRVGLTSITIKDFLNKKWNWKIPKLISPPGEIHKNWLIFPEKINGKYAVMHSIVPKIEITYLDDLNFDKVKFINSPRAFGPQKGNANKTCWDKWIRGPGSAPVKTSKGWLLFYHAMGKDWGKYKIGVMLLDLKDPSKILHRSKEPVLEPDEWYENNGFKPGIVYVTGAVVKDGKLLVYYGGADSCVNLAYANLDKFLENLTKTEKPKLKTAITIKTKIKS